MSLKTKGELRLMFNLTISQAKQVLVRESKQVRRAVIKKLETLELHLTDPAHISHLQNRNQKARTIPKFYLSE